MARADQLPPAGAQLAALRLAAPVGLGAQQRVRARLAAPAVRVQVAVQLAAARVARLELQLVAALAARAAVPRAAQLAAAQG